MSTETSVRVKLSPGYTQCIVEVYKVINLDMSALYVLYKNHSRVNPQRFFESVDNFST